MPFEEEKQDIIPINVEEEMKHSYLDYAMSTIVGRALPDVRDGLKPVHRRVLFAMHEMGNVHNKPYKKSARIVGDVMGKYHPHGNDAIYDTMVRMAQNFTMSAPLIDGQGNFGSIDGDAAAAMRYTEVRLERITEELLADIQEETVDFIPNYDNTIFEPAYLPAKFPNLLVNGSSGIAVGMATNMAPHNLGEVIDALQHLISNPDCAIIDLMTLIPGPDFPTAGFILGHRGIKEAYLTGRGIIKMRAKLHSETGHKGSREKIVVTEIPYQVNKTSLIEQIAGLAHDGRLKEIADLRDESDREGMRIVIEIKRGENPHVVANKLYKMTRLQTSFGIINLALHNGRPKVMDLKQLMVFYLDHRKQVIIRRTRYRLRKARERAHILEGLKIALDNIELVIKIIRSSADAATAKQALVEKLNLSEIQAKAILDMRLARLTGLERDKIINELTDVLKTVEYLEKVLANPKMVMDIISVELADIKKKYAIPRRTEIIDTEEEISIEDIIADEEMVVSVTRGGYIKRVPISIYGSQHRGGKGKAAMATKVEDFVESLFVASNHDTMLFFTQRGMAYALKVYEIPEAGRTAKGTAMVNLLQIDREDSVAATVTTREFSEDRYVFFCSKHGYVKRTVLYAFRNAKRRGIIAIGMPEDDRLIDCHITTGAEDVMLATKKGISIRFHTSQVRFMGRNARGVIGIRLRKGDAVVAMTVLTNSDGKILFASENGYGKRTKTEEFRDQHRSGKGIIAMRTTEKTGQLIGALEVNDDDHIVLINSNGDLIRTRVSEISVIGRATQGVKLIRIQDDQKLTDLAKVIENEESQTVNN